MKPSVGKLGGWITSWIQPDGAIHGFHNHSVWGGNPYRWSDFSCGHSTWASPFLAGLSLALQQQWNAEGLELLKRLIGFQTNSFQDNGHYNHIGFQVGDSLKSGLIHNAITNVSLGLTAWYGRDYLPSEQLEAIRTSILRNMESCRRYGDDGRPGPTNSTCNQEYARIWAKLLFQQAFDDDRWKEQLREDLAYMITNFHVSGLPDGDCAGTYRTEGDKTTVEPSEYYGLMILPLVLAYEVYKEELYLDHAGAICRHVARSAWTDSAGHTRLHRLYYRHGGTWRKYDGPMLIAGMGDSLNGILRYLEHRPDAELTAFLDRCDETYAGYQNPRGYFVSATGWQSEVDIAPSTAWHAHDFLYLVARNGIGADFWNQMQEVYAGTSVLLGDQCMWVERGNHWSINDYYWQDVFKLLGRKDEAYFGRDIPAWTGIEERLPDPFVFPQLPVFLKAEEGIYMLNDHGLELDVTSIASVPYKGKLTG